MTDANNAMPSPSQHTDAPIARDCGMSKIIKETLGTHTNFRTGDTGKFVCVGLAQDNVTAEVDMDGNGKKEHEAFRVGKFAHDVSHPHRHVAYGTEEGSSQECHEVEEEEHDVGAPDSSRVILHFDAGNPLYHTYTYPLFFVQEACFIAFHAHSFLISAHYCTS